MNLSIKQISMLSMPFFFSILIYMFDVDIVKNIQYLFPNYEEYSNKTLDKKADIYLKILSKDKIYQEIKEKATNRKEYASWIADNILYKNFTQKHTAKQERKIMQKVQRTYSWKLQAVFNKKKIAIINSKIVKLGSIIDGGRLVEIQENRVLIKYAKGLKKWIHLFQ